MNTKSLSIQLMVSLLALGLPFTGQPVTAQAIRVEEDTLQFLVEALILSSVGGAIGVGVGTAGAYLITWWVEWPTIIHLWTILVSAGLALAVGMFFGIYPAARAAALHPIEALRFE